MTDYRLADPSQVPSPALLFYRDRIRHNIGRMLARAGSADRLRPHCKTHKTRQIIRMLLEAGVTKHKCATIAEAEMLAQEKVPDILIAYPLVGPNTMRLVGLMMKYPGSKFRTLVDSLAGAEGLSRALSTAELTAETILDLDVGQHRTGIAPGAAAVELYAKIASLPGLKSGGLQAYDGHVHQGPLAEREASVASEWQATLATRDELRRRGHVVPRIVVGGTPSMPGWEHVAEAEIELSPGTCVLSDHGYGSRYADMSDFVVAAAMLTRVVSKPTANRVTLDLGTKSVASDPPAGKRTRLLEIPDAEQVAHNEEHLVIETPSASKWAIGDVTYAWPTHICPTCALHMEALVVEEGKIVDRWPIASRDRRLTI